jgi:phosphoribosyl 1,2-cyclic phosphodiesterase
MSITHPFNVRFWGVRGSIPSPGRTTAAYGGNTPCVEVHVAGHRLIFDAGSGIRDLGLSLQSSMPIAAHLFFSHTHWDHIQGFPFFTPAYVPGNGIDVYGVPCPDGQTIKERLSAQMLNPHFPVPLQCMQSDLRFHDLACGDKVAIDDVIVESALLNHPGEAIGYRVNWRGHAVAYVTDTEHFADRLDENVVQLSRNADILIYDAMYTDEEYGNPRSSKVGWGHSTWQEAVKVAKAAGVKQLVIFHHDPTHDDACLDRIGVAVAAAFPKSVIAREGLELTVIAEGAILDPRGSANV